MKDEEKYVESDSDDEKVLQPTALRQTGAKEQKLDPQAGFAVTVSISFSLL